MELFGQTTLGDGSGVSAPTPTSFYLSKVFFEDRLTAAQFAAFDGLRVTVLNRPADWATSSVDPWPAQRALVRPMLRYESAQTVNVLDADLSATFQSFAAANPALFGDTPDAVRAELARILTPTLLPREIAAG